MTTLFSSHPVSQKIGGGYEIGDRSTTIRITVLLAPLPRAYFLFAPPEQPVGLAVPPASQVKLLPSSVV